MIEPREKFLAGGAGFLDDWVFPHCRHRSISSCGVQMTGGSYPDALHCLSIARRIVALAMWQQFHESKTANEIADDARLQVYARLHPITVTDSKASRKIRFVPGR